jgi:hypothetical protein
MRLPGSVSPGFANSNLLAIFGNLPTELSHYQSLNYGVNELHLGKINIVLHSINHVQMLRILKTERGVHR